MLDNLDDNVISVFMNLFNFGLSIFKTIGSMLKNLASGLLDVYQLFFRTIDFLTNFIDTLPSELHVIISSFLALFFTMVSFKIVSSLIEFIKP